MAINVPLNAQLQNASQLQQQIQNAVNSVRINLGGSNGARALSSLSQPLGRLTGQADEFTKSLDAANARVLAFGASVGVVNAISNAFQSLVKSTIEVEKAITAISVVGDKFAGKTKELGQGLFNIAKTTGQSFDEVSKAALEFSRQGLELEDTLKNTQDALILTRLTGLDAAKSVDGLTAAANAFSKAGLSTTQIINKLAAVDQAFAVSSADLIEGFNRSAAVAQNAGVSFDELAGIITALQQETSRGGAVIGNALKTIFTRLQDTNTLKQLQNLGIAVQDLEGNLLPARQILQNLATDVQGLGQITKAGIFKDVAGAFQINQLISLVGDLGKANSVTSEATKKSAGATNEAYVANEKLNQSLDAILNKVATTGKQLGSILGEIGLSDNLKGLLDGINSFLESANNVLQGDDLGSKFATGFVKGIGSVLSGPGIGLFLAIIVKLSADLVRFGSQSLKAFFNIGKAASDQKQVQESIVQTLLRNQGVLNNILNTQGGQNAQGLKFLGILNQQAAAMQSIQTLAGGIASTVYAGGYRSTAGGLQRKAAVGYLPAQEAADVSRGVGGASPSSKVVSIPNFAFGGGKRGTMIANTSEYIVPNYAGGGSAIFNQDMVRSMGLPPGAQKISAAGGFIPNFANQPLDVSGKYALIINKAISSKIGEIFSYKPKGSEDSVSYRANIYGIDERKIKNNKNLFEKNFSSDALVKKYTEIALQDASDYSSAVVGRPISPVTVKKLSNAGSIPSLVGAIFESGITAAIEDPELIKAQQEGNPNAPFDFIGTPKLNKFFGIPESVPYVEAKYSDTPDTKKSFAGKIFKAESGITKGLQEALARKSMSNVNAGGLKSSILRYKEMSSPKLPQAQELYAQIASQMGYRPIQDRNKINTQIKQIIGASSSGYVPNFAAAALQQAIAREKTAGLSNSQIYVDQNPSLKSNMNPMGLMVANTRDEPLGGFQGVSRARKEGVNPKIYGAANGFIPNYAVSGGTDPFLSSASSAPDPQQIEKVNKGFADTAGKIFLLQSALSFLQGAVGDTEDSFSKITNSFASAIGNITSLALLGKEIKGIKIDGSGVAAGFGRFAKSLGIAGIAFGALTEGFKFADFALKEFSGENKKAALGAAKLAEATGKASLKLEELSQVRQKELEQNASKILGESGFQSSFGNLMSSIFGTEKKAGGNLATDTVKKGAAQILALGGTEDSIKAIIKEGRKTATQKIGAGGYYGTSEITTDITQASDIEEAFAKAFESGIGKSLNEAVNKFKINIAGLNPNDTNFTSNVQNVGAKAFGQNDFKNLNENQKKLIDEQIRKRQELGKQQKQEQETQNKINFGERLILEIAKKRIDATLELKKIQIQSTNEEEARIQFQTETLDLSNRQKILNEAQLKQLDLEKKKRSDIVDSIQAAINKSQEGGLSVDKNKLEDLQKFLTGIDFSKEVDFKGLQAQLQSTYSIGEDQAKNLINSVIEEKNARETITQESKKQIDLETKRKLTIDGVNQSLASQLSTIQRIASTAESIGNLNISGIDLQNSQTKGQIAQLQAQLSNPNLTEGQKNTINAQINGLEKIVNLREKDKAVQEQQSKTAQITAKIFERQKELDRLKKSPQDEETIKKITENEAALANLGREQAIVNNNYESSISSLNSNNSALEIQASLIGKVVGAYASLQQQLEAFRLGAGTRVGGAMLDELGATDINSVIQARIKQQTEAGGAKKSNDQDRYKFVQEETRLRQIQFDLSTAESATRKRELEYELKYTQELIDLKNKGASDQELIDAKNRQILEQRSGGRGFEKGLDTIQDRINNYRSTLGEEIPNLFSSNLAQGLNDAISGAKDLKTALTDAATSFFQAITQKNISNLADLVTSGFGSFGSVIGKASGGFISGGSGTKDDVPAMLMGGEYVVKKSAVSKYGKGFLDSLNNGSMRGYATGGLVDPQTFPTQTGRGGFFTPGDYGQGAITGKNELLAFATQTNTGGRYDYMGGFGMNGATVSLEPESARLSATGRENSPMFERIQQSKDEAFRVYLEGLQKEKEYADLLDQIAKDKKARKKQLQTAIISAVISSAASYAGNTFATGAKNASASSLAAGGKGGFLTSVKGGFSNLGNLFSPSKALGLNSDAQFLKSIGVNSYKDLRKLPIENSLKFAQQYPNIGTTYTNFFGTRRAAGGLISGGSNIRDDVPAMLTGGEFVLNNRATQRIGLQNLTKLNNGQTTDSGASSADMTQALISKLDELIQATQNSSSDNVVVNVSTNEAGTQNQESSVGAEKELGKKIKQAVLDVIAQEKRLGGSLEKAR